MNDFTLTGREHEICEAVAEMKSAPEIAADLGIEVATVRTHIYRIGQKLPGSGPPMRRISKWWGQRQHSGGVRR